MTSEETRREEMKYGLIGLGVMLLFVGTMGYFGLIQKKERELQAERAIPIYDTDKNYRLSTNEFYKLINERVMPKVREKYSSLFKEADRDKNGELTERELEGIIGNGVQSSIVEGMSLK